MSATIHNIHTQFQQLEYECQLSPKSEQVPIDMLFATVRSKLNKGLSWRLELYLEPLEKESEIHKLEFVVPVVNVAKGTSESEIYEHIIALNAKIYLGTFGYDRKHRIIYYQHHILGLNNEMELPDALLAQTLDLINFHLSTFSGYFYNMAMAKPFEEERKIEEITPFKLDD
jgi:hypothetical protein